MKTQITIDDYSRFTVTGIDRNGKRFCINYGPDSVRFAFAINLYSGSVWGIRKTDGKRELLKRVQN